MTTCSSQHDHQPCIVKKHTAIVCPTVNNRLNIHNRCSTRGSLLASLTPTVSFSTSVDGHSTGCSAYCPPIYFGIGITLAQRRRETTRHPTTAPHPPEKLNSCLKFQIVTSNSTHISEVDFKFKTQTLCLKKKYFGGKISDFIDLY